MTAYGSIPKAVEAMKEGAYDYLAKPFDPEEALLVVQRAVERKRLRRQAADLRSALQDSYFRQPGDLSLIHISEPTRPY